MTKRAFFMRILTLLMALALCVSALACAATPAAATTTQAPTVAPTDPELDLLTGVSRLELYAEAA